jgi:hypothetical protein
MGLVSEPGGCFHIGGAPGPPPRRVDASRPPRGSRSVTGPPAPGLIRKESTVPGSFNNFDGIVRHLITAIAPDSLLDIGCGAGKYGRMARDAAPSCRRVGIEAAPSYVTAFDLGALYDEIRVGEAWPALLAKPDDCHDLCIIGDCIEHMPKSVGLDLLNFLTYRTRYLIVLAPEFYVQGSVNGIASEAHVSVWSERDFTWHDRWAWDHCFMISCFVLRGYQPSPLDFDTLIDGLNTARIPIVAPDDGRDLRPARFNKQVTPRVDCIGGARHAFRPQ